MTYKPCPFCGGEGQLHKELRSGYSMFRDDPDAWAYYVVCKSCAAQGGWAKNKYGGERLWEIREGER